jgi:cytoskeletal protein CcmA (bactofilin family)
MLRKFLISIAVLALIIPSAAHAAEFNGAEEYTLRSNEVIEENLYIGGGLVSVEGGVDGDLFVGGGDVTVSGNVSEDLAIGAGKTVVSGDVAGDVRIGSGNVTISGHVGGEVIASGGYVHITSNAVIDGDVLLAGGRILMEGSIKGDLAVYGGEIEFGGIVEGNITSQGEKIVIGKYAVLQGVFDYKSPNEAVIKEGAQVNGKVVYTYTEKGNGIPVDVKFETAMGLVTGILGILWLLSLVVCLILTSVIFALTKKKTEEMVLYTVEKFWTETLRGLIIAILLPIISIIACITIFGMGLGVLGFSLLLLFTILAKVGASILTGTFVFWIFTKKMQVNWKSVIVGVFVLHFIRFIPIIGWIGYKIVFLAAFGALWMFLYKAFKK